LSDPPLFEVRPAGYLDYLYLVDNISAWLKDRTALPAFAAISRWLRRQNLDYFVIPVPKLTEVYPDLMASHVPGNRIVAPHVRRLLWELLNKDVEVLDLLPRDLAARKTVRGALYYSVDPHWNQAGQMIAVKEIAARLRRFPEVEAALTKAPIAMAREVEWTWNGTFYEALTPEQKLC
jgi:hypothetical protein